MGDTFTDDFDRYLPETFDVFKFEEQENRKSGVNNYRYHYSPIGQCEEDHYLCLVSTGPGRLTGRLTLRKPGFTIDIEHFGGDIDRATDEWIPGVYFNTPEEAMKSTLAKYREILPVFQALTPGKDWEGA